MTFVNDQIQTHWTTITPRLTIRNEREYNVAVKRLNELLDEIRTDERGLTQSDLPEVGS